MIAREDKRALAYGIAGLFCFGPILGSLAFMSGRDARKRIAVNPKLRGRAMALTAQLIGIADVVLAAVALVWRPQGAFELIERLFK